MAVEFALVFGILILLVFGMFEFGRAIYFGNAVEFLTDRAARSSILAPGCALSPDAVSGIRNNAFGVTGEALSISPANASNLYMLRLTYDLELVVPIYGDRIITLTATRDLSQFCSNA